MLKKNKTAIQIEGFLQVFEELKTLLTFYEIREVANCANVATSTIFFWLSGRTKSPRLDTFTRVSDAVGFKLELIRVDKGSAKKYIRSV